MSVGALVHFLLLWFSLWQVSGRFSWGDWNVPNPTSERDLFSNWKESSYWIEKDFHGWAQEAFSIKVGCILSMPNVFWFGKTNFLSNCKEFRNIWKEFTQWKFKVWKQASTEMGVNTYVLTWLKTERFLVRESVMIMGVPLTHTKICWVCVIAIPSLYKKMK